MSCTKDCKIPAVMEGEQRCTLGKNCQLGTGTYRKTKKIYNFSDIHGQFPNSPHVHVFGLWQEALRTQMSQTWNSTYNL